MQCPHCSTPLRVVEPVPASLLISTCASCARSVGGREIASVIDGPMASRCSAYYEKDAETHGGTSLAPEGIPPPVLAPSPEAP